MRVVVQVLMLRTREVDILVIISFLIVSVELFSRLDTSLSLSLINILAPPSARGSTFHVFMITMTPEQNHIYVQIYAEVESLRARFPGIWTGPP